MDTHVIDAVSTHIPVLDLIKRLSNIRRILEFGCGVYSTNKLLEFPRLELLTSYEDSQGWFDKISKVSNKKLKLIFESDLLRVAREICLDEFDLIFIDSCDSQKKRADIIDQVSRRKPKAIVIIHDFDDELERFPESIKEFDNMAVYRRQWPATGIMWNQIEGSAEIQGVRFDGIQGILNS